MEEDNIYFEKQHLLQCGIHAVNSLLQEQIYDQATFDAIAGLTHSL